MFQGNCTPSNVVWKHLRCPPVSKLQAQLKGRFGPYVPLGEAAKFHLEAGDSPPPSAPIPESCPRTACGFCRLQFKHCLALPLLPGESGMGPGARSGPTHRTRQKPSASVRPPRRAGRSITGTRPTGTRRPTLPRLPACCLRWAGPAPPGSVPSGSFPAPLPPPCPKAPCRREPYGPLWTRFPQYSMVRACMRGLAPQRPPPPQPPGEPQSPEPCRVGVSEASLSNTHPPTHTHRKRWKSNVSKSDPFLV